MSKILYIEDELTKNIASIKKLFQPLMKDKKLIKRLDELEGDDYITADSVVDACSYLSFLDICYTLTSALAKIISNHLDYDLILIDRNLFTYHHHDDSELIESHLSHIGLENFSDRLIEYKEREGDLLLLVLLKLNPAYKDKIYYITANTKDDLKGSPELQTLMDVSSFSASHIIEKGMEFESVICTILADMKAFAIQNKFRKQCEVLRTRLCEDDVNQFVDIVRYSMSDRKAEFLILLRKLLDTILHSLAFEIGEEKAGYWNESIKKQLHIKTFIKGSNTPKGFIPGLPDFDQRRNVSYNSIIQNACLSIFEITSDCGVHSLSKSIDIVNVNISNVSSFTVQSLLAQICDVINWYDKAMGIITSK